MAASPPVAWCQEGVKAIMTRWSERIGTVGDWMTGRPGARLITGIQGRGATFVTSSDMDLATPLAGADTLIAPRRHGCSDQARSAR